MHDIIFSLIDFLKGYSYLGVMLLLTIEFIPSEIVLPLVGYWVYEGDMVFILGVLAGSIGGTTGPLTLYFLGFYGGRPFLKKYGKYLFITEDKLEKSDEFFNKYGPSIAFFGRFIPGIRTLVSIPCGISKMNIWKFSLYTFFAMIPLTSFYIYIGLTLGKNYEKASEVIEPYLGYIGISLLLVIFLLVSYKFLIKKPFIS